MENISWELALKLHIYYINPIYTYISPSLKGTLARGMTRPGKAPTSAKELSPGVWLARGKHPHPPHPRSSVPAAHRVSATSPRTGLASGKLPTRLPSLPCAPTGFYFLIQCTQVGRVSLLPQEVPPPCSGLCRDIVWPVETGPTIH